MKQPNKSTTHLLVFIYSMGDGGAERVTASLANYWVIQGRAVTIVTLAPQSTDLFELHPDVQRISLGLASESATIWVGLWRNFSRVLALRRLLRQLKPDIAIGMMTRANVVLAFAAWGLSQIKTIGCEHNYPKDRSEGRLWDFLRRHSYGLLDVVTGLTTEGKAWLVGNTRTKTAVVMPNPMLWPLPLNEPRLLPPVSGRRILLAVGRMVEQKSFDILIEAFSNLAPVHSEWDLWILGDGPLRPALEQQIHALGLQNRVFMPGRGGNISEWYERADLYVLSSRFEGLPMTLIEAMAYGVAAVSFDCNTGPRDIIRHEVDGLLVPPEDSAGLSAALARLMGDDATRQRLAGRALEARERFSMARITDLWEQLFEEP